MDTQLSPKNCLSIAGNRSEERARSLVSSRLSYPRLLPRTPLFSKNSVQFKVDMLSIYDNADAVSRNDIVTGLADTWGEALQLRHAPLAL